MSIRDDYFEAVVLQGDTVISGYKCLTASLPYVILMWQSYFGDRKWFIFLKLEKTCSFVS